LNNNTGTAQLQTMQGTVDSIRYDSPEFTVASFVPDGEMLNVTICGAMPGIIEGQDLLLSGKWGTLARYGEQFRVESYSMRFPTTTEGIKRFLGSGQVTGIGPGLAERIVANFGDKTLHVMDTDIQRLGDVRGIGKKKLEKIAGAWDEQRKVARLMSALMEVGVGNALAARLYKEYGEQAEQVVRLEPYRIAEVWGVGFITADGIARNIGIAHEDAARLEAGTIHTLQEMSNLGHTCAPRGVLIEKAASERLLDVDPKLVDQAITRLLLSGQLVAQKDIVVEQDKQPVEAIFLPWLYAYEIDVAETLTELAAGEPSLNVDLDKVQPCIEDITLSDQQFMAVKMALSRKVTCITGGPGTGKTTLIKTILHALQTAVESPVEIAMAAPTGKASKRMTEVCQFPACTIHRLLGAKGPLEFTHNQEDPIEADVLIVDECSMIDITLFRALLKALPPHAHLIMVGDADQLPSIGPGDVMATIASCPSLPVSRLSGSRRQASDSTIVENAHRIINGKTPAYCKNASDGAGDFFFFTADETVSETGETVSAQTNARDMIVDLVAHRIPEVFGVPSTDIQVLSPLRKRGDAGANNLNLSLQDAVNPQQHGRDECVVGNRRFRTGDRVIQVRNNYDRGVFNGEMGVITAIDSEESEIYVDFSDVEAVYGYDETHNINLAYALTIHKSQGSEYPVVVIPCLLAHFIMLRRNLLYTAVTRAKQMVVLVGEHKAVHIALNESRRETRYSGLQWRLAQEAQLHDTALQPA